MAEGRKELQYSSIGKRKITLPFIIYVKKIVAILAINTVCKKKNTLNLDCQCNAIMPG